MPSVPLIRARPSFAPSWTGVSPAAASASAAGISVPSGIADVALAHQHQRTVRQRREVAGAAERAVLADHRRDPRGQQRGHQLRRLASYAGVAGRQRREPQQHQPAHDLALHLRPGPRRVGADQGALELLAQLGRDVPGRQGAEPRRDAVRRRRGRRELLDDRPRPVDRRRAPRRSATTPAPSRATASTSSKDTGPTPTRTLSMPPSNSRPGRARQHPHLGRCLGSETRPGSGSRQVVLDLPAGKDSRCSRDPRKSLSLRRYQIGDRSNP